MPTGIYERRPLIDRFWLKVDTSGECWEWKGARSPRGYGKIGVDKQVIDTHRVAWMLANGPIPKGQVVRHLCDNPPCVRLSHLAVGTQKDNMADAVSKGRVQSGESHYKAKLSDQEIATLIRSRVEDPTQTFKALGIRFGISMSQAHRLVRHQRRHTFGNESFDFREHGLWAGKE